MNGVNLRVRLADWNLARGTHQGQQYFESAAETGRTHDCTDKRCKIAKKLLQCRGHPHMPLIRRKDAAPQLSQSCRSSMLQHFHQMNGGRAGRMRHSIASFRSSVFTLAT
jgi:hypothetical protein